LSKLSNKFKTHLVKPVKENKLKRACIESLHHSKKQTITPYIQSESEFDESNKLDTYIKNNQLNELKNSVRVLVAEDVYINQRVIMFFLNNLGFNTITMVENGKQCLDKIKLQDFDIVLLDIRMPIMNGEVALQKIKEYFDSNPYKTIPYIVAVTAYCLKDDKNKYLSQGFKDYIPKPITLTELSRCMNTFFEHLLNN